MGKGAGSDKYEVPQMVIACTEDSNMFVAERKFYVTDADAKIQLFTTASINLSSYVNSIVPGSLVMKPTPEMSSLLFPDSDNNWLLGSRDGSVHSLLRITEPVYQLLYQLQDILRESHTAFELPSTVPEKEKYGLDIISVGGISHEKWRRFEDVKESEGFVDGNLIETLLNFSKSEIEQLFQHKELLYDNQPILLEDVLKLVDEL